MTFSKYTALFSLDNFVSERRPGMAELFILAFLGHLIGDYLLQPTWMAIGKSKKDWRGFWVCTAHVPLYTTAVCAMMQVGNPFIWVLVFVPH